MAYKEITPEKARELKTATKVVYEILENFYIGKALEDGWDDLAAFAGKLHTQLESGGY